MALNCRFLAGFGVYFLDRKSLWCGPNITLKDYRIGFFVITVSQQLITKAPLQGIKVGTELTEPNVNTM